MNYIDRLIKNGILAKEASPIKEFELRAHQLSDLSNIQQGIYIIEEINGDIEDTFKRFQDYKYKKERSCAKLNSPSAVMYVGSSTTGIKKRIEQHLGYGHKSTYSLHLNHWFKGEFKIIIKQYNVSKEILQIIEDDLSDRLKPAFGKKGGHNK